jgi:hypothetical protein
MDLDRTVRHHDEQIGDLLRRVRDLPALPAQLGRARDHRMVKLTETLTAGGKATCSVQRLSYDTIPNPTSATWADLADPQTITVFDSLLVAAGYSGNTISSGTLCRIEQDPYSGIWYFSDFYACPTAPSS